jgi:HEAT repeat protein
LVRSGDPELATVLLPLLRDADLLVRMGAARGLGSLGNPNAIPALIEALEDAEAPVREAAVFSLRLLTGLDLKYDPLAPAPDRARRVEAWRRWWERGGAEELDQNELRRP